MKLAWVIQVEVIALPIIICERKYQETGSVLFLYCVMLRMTFMLPIATFQTTVNVVVTDLIHLGMVCRKFALKHYPVPATALLTLVG